MKITTRTTLKTIRRKLTTVETAHGTNICIHLDGEFLTKCNKSYTIDGPLYSVVLEQANAPRFAPGTWCCSKTLPGLLDEIAASLLKTRDN